jgi:CO/xanthine dehydrogenase Mo-binding subunit
MAGQETRLRDPVPRVDAALKASGRALYLDDIRVDGMLYARMVRSTRPRARILAVRHPALPDGYAMIDARHVPAGGTNGILMIKDDWPVFADREVRFRGQTIALVVGPDRAVLDDLAAKVEVDYEDLPPVFTIEDSLALLGGPIHGPDNLFSDFRLCKGDPEAAFGSAATVVEEEFTTGWQEHVYMETQGCIASWKDGRLTLHASTQCPYYLQKAVAHALGCRKADVRVIAAHTGGGFGGKEHYPDVLATAAAVASRTLARPVQIVLGRQEDIQTTIKRHPSVIRIRTGLAADGSILAMDIDTRLAAGAFETCTSVVLQRAIFTSTGAYDIPNVRVRGRAFATNVVPSDAFRGFGAPQALFAIEMHMNHLARRAGGDPVRFKTKHFLSKGSVTVTNGTIRDEVLLGTMLERITASSGYAGRGAAARPWHGVGVSFFNHGCAFTGSGERDIIKGRVGLRRAADGSVRILSAGVDIGQGLSTTFRKIVAAALALPVHRVLFDQADTDQVPDSGPTCASRSIMIVGWLLQEAAKGLAASWRDGTAQEEWQEYVHPAHLSWDPATLQGDAYPTYGWGINVVEVQVDPVTFEVDVQNVWTIYDVGYPIDSLIVEGQAHGGMSQALGWAGLEKLEQRDGVFLQGTMADYCIPTSLDFPPVRTELVENPYPFGPFGAKGSGELVFDGGAPAFAAAVEQAIGAEVRDLPLTPERVREIVAAAARRAGAAGEGAR